MSQGSNTQIQDQQDSSSQFLADRMSKVKSSPSMAVAAKAAELKAEGKTIISLSVGEPDFDTPDHIKSAAIEAIRAGQTKYTPLPGIAPLREAICAKFERDNQLSYQPNEIVVTAGGKQGCYNLMMAIINPGDEVVIPAPYWVSYPDMVLLADGNPVIVSTEESTRYKVTAEQLRESMTNKTKCVILNSPSNPTGSAYTRAELEAIGEVIRDYPDTLVLSDDIYEPILWSDEPFANLAMVCPDLKDRIVIINGVSKAYAMTGWRIGYTASTQTLAKQMAKVQSQCSSNACSVSQAASLAALNGPQDFIADMRKAYHRRYQYVHKRLNAIYGVSMPEADGAFYGFANCDGLIRRLDGVNDDVELCARWLDAGVALVPGSAFGADNCVRFSFATSDENLEQALDLIEADILN